MAEEWIKILHLDRLDGIQKWVYGIEEIIHKPGAMAPYVRSFGTDVSFWFNGETTPLGRRWQPLSQMTNDPRRTRNYPERHPVLVQSGQLKAFASTPFENWRDTTANVRRSGIQPYGNFEPLNMSASIIAGHFHANISGSRVKNQYGGAIAGARSKKLDTPRTQLYTAKGHAYMGHAASRPARVSALPSRPFWGLTRQTIDNGREGSMHFIFREWGKLSRELGIK